MNYFAWTSLLATLGGLGCSNAHVMSDLTTTEANAVNACARAGEATSASPNSAGDRQEVTPLASTFNVNADYLRDEGLNAFVTGKNVNSRLGGAIRCYGRMLDVSPDSYNANFGLGITYVGLAKTVGSTTVARRSYLASAKRFLGTAYMIRRGHYEPLYYLAEVAVLERDYARARAYLRPLQKANMKAGPVAALLGYIYEKEGDLDAAAAMYEIALSAGWPKETIEYINNKNLTENRSR